MEAASESRPGRTGRPPTIPREFLATLREASPTLTTRQLHEHAYAMRALSFLGDDETLSWLWEPRLKISVLAELGRIASAFDNEWATTFARQLCSMTPHLKVKDAQARLRQALQTLPQRLLEQADTQDNETEEKR
jgi:hypothetical protein